MLNARYLASVSDELVKFYAQLETDIALDVARRIGRLQKITETTEYQIKLMEQTGELRADIQKLVAKYNAGAEPILRKAFENSAEKSTANDLKYFKLGERELSESQAQVMETNVNRFLNADKINKTYYNRAKVRSSFDETYKSIQRMTLTVADSVQQTFITECNKAFMKVSTGMTSYQSAYKTAVKNMACDGVSTVTYSSSGRARSYSIETATRMNILTGVNQSAAQQTLENCESLNTDLVEVSAHIGARDTDGANPWSNHSAWQGKVYCLNGERTYIDENGDEQIAPDFQSSCGLGEPDGICGINCRHSYYPYFEGTPRNYSDGELDELKEEKVTAPDGHEMSQYEAEQKLRYYERNIRTTKREIDAIEIQGADHTAESQQLKAWQKEARDFCNATGLRRDYTREYVGTMNATQPR